MQIKDTDIEAMLRDAMKDLGFTSGKHPTTISDLNEVRAILLGLYETGFADGADEAYQKAAEDAAGEGV